MADLFGVVDKKDWLVVFVPPPRLSDDLAPLTATGSDQVDDLRGVGLGLAADLGTVEVILEGCFHLQVTVLAHGAPD